MKNEITIDGTTYVALDAIDSPVKIVVIEGRWNIVGRVETHEDDVAALFRPVRSARAAAEGPSDSKQDDGAA